MPVYKHGKQWRAIVQHNGRRRSAVAKTQADAKRREAELLLELGTTAKTSDVTLGELIDMHIAQSRLADTTRDDYQRIRKRLPDWMTAWPVHRVSRRRPRTRPGSGMTAAEVAAVICAASRGGGGHAK